MNPRHFLRLVLELAVIHLGLICFLSPYILRFYSASRFSIVEEAIGATVQHPLASFIHSVFGAMFTAMWLPSSLFYSSQEGLPLTVGLALTPLSFRLFNSILFSSLVCLTMAACIRLGFIARTSGITRVLKRGSLLDRDQKAVARLLGQTKKAWKANIRSQSVHLGVGHFLFGLVTYYLLLWEEGAPQKSGPFLEFLLEVLRRIALFPLGGWLYPWDIIPYQKPLLNAVIALGINSSAAALLFYLNHLRLACAEEIGITI